MPIDALRAAAALGDADAIWELNRMRDNTKTVLLAAISILGVVSLALGAIWMITDYLSVGVAQAHTQQLEESRSAAKLREKEHQDAATLRLKYVQSCRVTPEQAEQLYPEPR